MNKIKVLRIIARLNIGGPAIHTVLLTEGLNKERFDSLLSSGSVNKGEADMSYLAFAKGVKPYYVKELRREINFIYDFISLIKIFKLIMIFEPDIIHTHTAKAGTIGRLSGILYNILIAGKRRVKIVHTFHGHVLTGYFGTFSNYIFIWIERLFACFTDTIITVSKSLKKELVGLRIAGEGKIKVIPLGLELGGFLTLPVQEGDVVNIGIVGRLVPIKNHHLFLQAAAILIKNNPGKNIKFKIVGDGELRKNLENYAARLGISGYVEFLGWQKNLLDIYADLDLIALTSINEGTPVSLIEGMASGRIVVATDVGGVGDLLGNEVTDEFGKENKGFKVLERGLIVVPEDPESFSQALDFILKNKQIKVDICLSAREYVRAKFSKERLIDDIENLYYYLLGI